MQHAQQRVGRRECASLSDSCVLVECSSSMRASHSFCRRESMPGIDVAAAGRGFRAGADSFSGKRSSSASGSLVTGHRPCARGGGAAGRRRLFCEAHKSGSHRDGDVAQPLESAPKAPTGV
eukprot:scaffold93614_cov28-Tisochrysis_lutea.AAC.1